MFAFMWTTGALCPLQFFIVKSVEGDDAQFHEFQVTGTTYTPEGIV
jgi:hypothetical protein